MCVLKCEMEWTQEQVKTITGNKFKIFLYATTLASRRSPAVIIISFLPHEDQSFDVVVYVLLPVLRYRCPVYAMFRPDHVMPVLTVILLQ